MYFFLFREYDWWDLSTSLVFVDESSSCSTAKKRFILKYGTWSQLKDYLTRKCSRDYSFVILKQTISLDILANVSRKQNRSFFFPRDVTRSIALQSPYLQIRVKLFVPNENLPWMPEVFALRQRGGASERVVLVGERLATRLRGQFCRPQREKDHWYPG